MQREAQGHREKCKEKFNVVYEIVKTTSLDTFISKPIAYKKNDGTYNKETSCLKNES